MAVEALSQSSTKRRAPDHVSETDPAKKPRVDGQDPPTIDLDVEGLSAEHEIILSSNASHVAKACPNFLVVALFNCDEKVVAQVPDVVEMAECDAPQRDNPQPIQQVTRDFFFLTYPLHLKILYY